LLIRPHPTRRGEHQVVLLDHGLYRAIDDDMRIDYAHLWRALIFGDEAGIKKYAAKMNAGAMYQLFAAMLTTRSWDQIMDDSLGEERLRIRHTAEDKAKTAAYVSQYSNEINEILGQIPHELLLLLKTNDCLRAVDHALGSPVNTFTIMSRYCVKAVQAENAKTDDGWTAWGQNTLERWYLEMRLSALSWMAWAMGR
jgi:aarF domain-containing kinase